MHSFKCRMLQNVMYCVLNLCRMSKRYLEVAAEKLSNITVAANNKITIRCLASTVSVTESDIGRTNCKKFSMEFDLKVYSLKVYRQRGNNPRRALVRIPSVMRPRVILNIRSRAVNPGAKLVTS